MILETLGHAGLALRDEAGRPLLLTDPWLIGSCYWRSWWMQNYPTAAQLEDLRSVRYCFITHEHPDHFHLPSIRTLGTGPVYFAPDLPEETIARHLGSAGFEARVLPAAQWLPLDAGISVLSLPAANDDSVLLIRIPGAVLINLNDCKPSASILEKIRKHLERHAEGRLRIVLSSYSPASVVNSFFRDGERVSLRRKEDYVRYVCRACDTLGADLFLPFASQAVFRRGDSSWANAFKVRFEDLSAGWTARAQLLHPYSRVRLDASGGKPEKTWAWIPEADYHQDATALEAKVRREEERDAAESLTAEDVLRLEKKLRASAPFLFLLFPRGLSFRAGGTTVHYNPWTFRARIDRTGRKAGNARFVVPVGILKDVLETGRFGDLGITMSVSIELQGRTDPRLIYGFFFLVTLHDYGHTTGLPAFFRWLRAWWRTRRAVIPAPPG